MPTPTYQEKVEAAAAAAADMALRLIEKGEASKDELAIAKIGVSFVSTMARLYATRNAENANMSRMLIRLAPTPDEYRHLVMATLPDSAITKALRSLPAPEPVAEEVPA